MKSVYHMTYTDQIEASLRIQAAQYRSLCQCVIDTAASYGGEWEERHVQVVVEVLRGIPFPVPVPPADWDTYDQAAYREAWKGVRKPEWAVILQEYIEQAKMLKK
jgi:hypothetical protein